MQGLTAGAPRSTMVILTAGHGWSTRGCARTVAGVAAHPAARITDDGVALIRLPEAD